MSKLVKGYTPVYSADFSATNITSEEVQDMCGSVHIYGPTNSSSHTICPLVQTAPTPPYIVTLRC